MSIRVEEGLDALRQAADLAQGYVPEESVQPIRDFLTQAAQRLELSGQSTVLCFAGGTGAGKSSLFNAVLGGAYSRTAPTRPTTSEALAVSSADCGAVLDYLQVRSRLIEPSIAARFPSLARAGKHSATDLIAVDLPDIDSDRRENTDTARRLISRSDAFVWVLDPQKYADSVIHEQYLQKMTSSKTTTIVVLNHIDTLTPAQRPQVLADVQRLLSSEGVDLPVIATSAVTGEGIDQLLHSLDRLIKQKSAARVRLAQRVQENAQQFEQVTRSDTERHGSSGSGGSGFELFAPSASVNTQGVAQTVAGALGARDIEVAVGSSYYLRGRKYTSWPVLRIVRRAKVDPLKRLHLDTRTRARKDSDVLGEEHPRIATATGVQVSETQRQAGRTAVGDLITDASAHLPAHWRRRVSEGMKERVEELFSSADSLVQGAKINYQPTPLWWRFVNLLQWLAVLIGLVGAVWLILWNAADMLKLRIPDPPAWGIFPLPTLGLVGAILVAWLLSAITIPLLRSGASRARRKTRAALNSSVRHAVDEQIGDPLSAELERYSDCRAALSRAAQTRA